MAGAGENSRLDLTQTADNDAEAPQGLTQTMGSTSALWRHYMDRRKELLAAHSQSPGLHPEGSRHSSMELFDMAVQQAAGDHSQSDLLNLSTLDFAFDPQKSEGESQLEPLQDDFAWISQPQELQGSSSVALTPTHQRESPVPWAEELEDREPASGEIHFSEDLERERWKHSERLRPEEVADTFVSARDVIENLQEEKFNFSLLEDRGTAERENESFITSPPEPSEGQKILGQSPGTFFKARSAVSLFLPKESALPLSAGDAEADQDRVVDELTQREERETASRRLSSTLNSSSGARVTVPRPLSPLCFRNGQLHPQTLSRLQEKYHSSLPTYRQHFSIDLGQSEQPPLNPEKIETTLKRVAARRVASNFRARTEESSKSEGRLPGTSPLENLVLEVERVRLQQLKGSITPHSSSFIVSDVEEDKDSWVPLLSVSSVFGTPQSLMQGRGKLRYLRVQRDSVPLRCGISNLYESTFALSLANGSSGNLTLEIRTSSDAVGGVRLLLPSLLTIPTKGQRTLALVFRACPAAALPREASLYLILQHEDEHVKLPILLERTVTHLPRLSGLLHTIDVLNLSTLPLRENNLFNLKVLNAGNSPCRVRVEREKSDREGNYSPLSIAVPDNPVLLQPGQELIGKLSVSLTEVDQVIARLKISAAEDHPFGSGPEQSKEVEVIGFGGRASVHLIMSSFRAIKEKVTVSEAGPRTVRLDFGELTDLARKQLEFVATNGGERAVRGLPLMSTSVHCRLEGLVLEPGALRRCSLVIDPGACRTAEVKGKEQEDDFIFLQTQLRFRELIKSNRQLDPRTSLSLTGDWGEDFCFTLEVVAHKREDLARKVGPLFKPSDIGESEQPEQKQICHPEAIDDQDKVAGSAVQEEMQSNESAARSKKQLWQKIQRTGERRGPQADSHSQRMRDETWPRASAEGSKVISSTFPEADAVGSQASPKRKAVFELYPRTIALGPCPSLPIRLPSKEAEKKELFEDGGLSFSLLSQQAVSSFLLRNNSPAAVGYKLLNPFEHVEVRPQSGVIEPEDDARVLVWAIARPHAREVSPDSSWSGELCVEIAGHAHAFRLSIFFPSIVVNNLQTLEAVAKVHCKKVQDVPQTTSTKAKMPLFLRADKVILEHCRRGDTSTQKVEVCNRSWKDMTVFVQPLSSPFHCRHRSFRLRSRSFVLLPITCQSPSAGTFRDELVVFSLSGMARAPLLAKVK